MKLADLEPQFLGAPYFSIPHYQETGLTEYHPRLDDIRGAKGIIFLCPVCFKKNGGPIRTHSIICWNGEVSQDFEPKPGRWNMHGTGYDDLTLTGANGNSSSVHLHTAECGAHFHVKNGMIE